MAGPTAASTPAKSQLKTSRIPVRQYLSSHQEIHCTTKATQPFADSSRSVHSVSVGTSSPRVLSSIGGASSEHHSTSLHHPTGVTMTQQYHPTGVTRTQQRQQQEHLSEVTATQQHYPTGVTMTQQHHPTIVMTTQQHPTGVMTTQQHHPTSVMTTQQHYPTGIMMQQHRPTGVTTTQQHYPTSIMMTQQSHPTGVTFTQQYHPTGVMITQANSVGNIYSSNLIHDAIPADNSLDISGGNRSTHTLHTNTCYTHITHTLYIL